MLTRNVKLESFSVKDGPVLGLVNIGWSMPTFLFQL